MKPDWAYRSADSVMQDFKLDSRRGLSSEEARRRLSQHGPNKLPESGGVSPLRLLAEQFTDFMVLVLIGATLISWFLGEHEDALAILAIVVLNALLGFVQEYRAERSLAALKQLSAPQAHVLRNGVTGNIPATEVVPGDLLLLESGDRVSADARVIWSAELEVEEAALTGESLPVRKTSDLLPKSVSALGDQHNMVFSGTLVTKGRAKAAVVATGSGTELGRIAGMIKEAESGETPLQKRLTQLGKWLVVACGAVCLLVGVIGVLRGEPVRTMFLSAVSLAVAAIPEGLPAIVTIALAIGVQRMIRRRAIIRRLPAVETLGCATVVCSDKTGTLTENEMTVVRLATPEGEYRITGSGYRPRGEFLTMNGGRVNPLSIPPAVMLLRAGALCNNAAVVNEQPAQGKAVWRVAGDPTEGALLVAAHKAGMSREELDRSWLFEAEFPFDSERKRMSVVCRDGHGERLIFAKGAPEAILPACSGIMSGSSVVPISLESRVAQEDQAGTMARDGLRVLALAYRPLTPSEGPALLSARDAEQNLILAGLVGMHDPPRPEVAHAIATCRRAGIRPVMITGDHPETAMAVAREIGLAASGHEMLTGVELDNLTQRELEQRVEKVSVFARVSPQHKLRIVKALKRRRHVVAMTGDGVNDAPAIKEADIGVAMGITGTEVTKEAAAMVISDDNFASIVAAVEEGRAIYDNIRKFIRYLLGCNIGEVLTMFVTAAAGLPLPLLPIQILWTNLVTDGLPALALGVDPPEPDLMGRPPRSPSEGVFARGLSRSIIAKGVMIGICTVALFILGLATGPIERARTLAFSTLVLSQLIFAFQCRSERHGLFETGIWGNPYLIGAVGISLSMQLSVIYVPALRTVFSTAALNLSDWGLVVLFSSLSMVIGELARAVRRYFYR